MPSPSPDQISIRQPEIGFPSRSVTLPLYQAGSPGALPRRSDPSGSSGAPSQKNGPCTVASVGGSGCPAPRPAFTPAACALATTSIEMPRVSDNRMNSWRFSSHILPVAVRNSMPFIHSSPVSSTSCTKAWACLTSAVMIWRKRGSGDSAIRAITASASWLASSWAMVRLLFRPEHYHLRGNRDRRARLRRRQRGSPRLSSPRVEAHSPPSPSSRADVLIVGAGPCGLMLACELGRRGIDCVVADPREAVAAVPQANATQARTMEHFRRLGLSERIRSLGLPPDHPTDIAYVTRFAGHELARLRLPTARQAREQVRHLGGSWSAAELPHRVSQRYVEATLFEHVRSLPSVRLRLGWKLQDFNDRGDHVVARITATAAPDEGENESLFARFLVGADGARSFVRSRLGIRLGGVTGIRRDFMGGRMFAVHLRCPGLYDALPHPRSWMTVTINAERRAFMCALDGDAEFVFHAAVHPDEDAAHWGVREATRVFEQAMGRSFPIEVLATGSWIAGHSLVAERFGDGNVLIGGDAAHLFTPTGGLGYNTAVEDAVNLGWKLAAVLRGISPP